MRRYRHGEVKESIECCIANVFPVPNDHDGAWQCSRKRGFGKGGLLCKQHAKVQESERGFLSIPSPDRTEGGP